MDHVRIEDEAYPAYCEYYAFARTPAEIEHCRALLRQYGVIYGYVRDTAGHITSGVTTTPVVLRRRLGPGDTE